MPIAKLVTGDTPHWVRFAPGTSPDAASESYATLDDALAGRQSPAPKGTARVIAPLSDLARIVCIGLNYRAHAAESGLDEPTKPVVFYRTRESLVGPDETMLVPAESERLDWEGELAVVIGKPGRRIAEADAMAHIMGYCCLNDGSVRDWQHHTSQYSPGKNFDASGAIGPWIATADEVGAPDEMQLTTRLNGTVVQDSPVSDLIFNVPQLIAYVSSFMALRTGDIISTGTPSGVGAARKPPQFLTAGDRVEITISGVGQLANPVAAD